MNFIKDIMQRIRNFVFRPPQEGGEANKEQPTISQKQAREINLWNAMFINDPPWRDDRIIPLGLPAAICRELSRTTLLEFQPTITGGERAELLQSNFDRECEHFGMDVELGLALGGVAFKPYVFDGDIRIDAAGPGAFAPTQFDQAGRCIGGVFKSRPVQVAGQWYVKLEHHRTEDAAYTIRNVCHHSDQTGSVGTVANLTDVPAWADLSPEASVENLTGPLFSYFKPPVRNNVDPTSEAGVSIYGGATADLIRQADEMWQLYRWEFRSGKRKIYIDGTSGDVGTFDKDLFETGLFTPSGDLFHEFSPAFRDTNIYNGYQSILRMIEYNVGLAFGTISDPEQTVAMTATAIRTSKQRMFVTIDGIQKALGHVFDGLLYAMDVQATLNGLPGNPGDYDAAYAWGDSVLNDPDTLVQERANDRLDMQAGIMSDLEYRMKWYGEDETAAGEALAKAQALRNEQLEPQFETE